MIKQELPFAFRFRPDNKNTLNELEKSYVYFQSPSLLNDPFDCYPNLLKFTENITDLKLLFQALEPIMSLSDITNFKRGILNNDFSKFRIFVGDCLNKFINSFGIACFSLSPSNLLMWSHYSNFHKGICLMYDTSKDKNAFKRIRPMDYKEEFEQKEFKPLSEGNEFEHVLYTKSDVWRNEYELRVIKEEQGEFKVNRNCLKTIIFGMQTSKKYKDKIFELTRNKYPELYYYDCEPLPDKFGLRFTQIE